MKRLMFTCGAALSLTLLGSAGAQNLTAYRQLKNALGEAVQHRTFSKAASLSDLQKAQRALDTLKPTLSSELLSKGLDNTLSAARASLARSPADLEAQVTQARGLMRAALYSQTLDELSRAPAPAAPLLNQSRLLAEEFGLSGAAISSLVNSASGGKLADIQRLLQQAAARKVQGYLSAVNLSDRAQAYLNLTRAASWFTAVQSAPAASSLQVEQFAAAFAALPGGDSGAARRALQTLRSGAASFLSAAQSRPSAQPPSPQPAQPRQTQPNPPLPTQAGNGAAAGPAKPPTTRPSVRPSAGNLTAADAIYAALGRALSAAAVADQPAARRALGDAEVALGQAGRLSSSASYAALATNLAALKTRSGLRPSDVQAMIGQLRNTEAEVAQQPVSALRSGAASLALSLGGGVQAAAFLLLALLCAYPLYLLNLAFGNRNPYWRSIFAGLLLLLLPVLLEGVGGFLGFLGDLGGVPALRSLTNLSLTQNAWGGLVWGLSVGLALAALIYGFRGLCLQFGLLGNARPMQTETQSSLEWDEEI